MDTRRTWLRRIGVAGTLGLVGCQGSTTTTATLPANDLAFESPAVGDGASIPSAYTADGADRSPPLRIKSVPDSAESLSMVVTDPDAGGFVHWLLWNVPAEQREIPSGLPNTETVGRIGGARQGTNDFGTIGYRGPAPPEGDGAHTYRFTLTALETTLSVKPGAERSTLVSAMDGRRLGEATITATYDR